MVGMKILFALLFGFLCLFMTWPYLREIGMHFQNYTPEDFERAIDNDEISDEHWAIAYKLCGLFALALLSFFSAYFMYVSSVNA